MTMSCKKGRNTQTKGMRQIESATVTPPGEAMMMWPTGVEPPARRLEARARLTFNAAHLPREQLDLFFHGADNSRHVSDEWRGSGAFMALSRTISDPVVVRPHPANSSQSSDFRDVAPSQLRASGFAV